MLAVYKKEMRSYFTSVIGYVFLVLYLIIAGAVFCYSTLFSMSSDVTTFYTFMLIVSSVMLPLLTMKSFSEERKAKTEQLLLTSPVSIIGIVAGKFLAAYTVFAACMVLNSLYFFFLAAYSYLKVAVLIGNLVAMLLVGMVYIAIGLFVSSLTENQLSAAIGTIAIILVFMGVGMISSLVPANYWFRFVVEALSVFTRFQSFVNGYFEFASVIYYLSVSAVFVWLTIRVYDRRRFG